MPPGIAGIVRMRKTHREGAKTVTRTPTPPADDLIEGGMERGRIDGFPERLLSIARKANDGPDPGCRVIAIARQIAPHDLTGLIGEFSGESPVDPDKAVLNELLDLRVAERARGFVFMSRHENPISFSQSQAHAKSGTGRLVRSKGNAPGRAAMGTFIFQPPRAAPSAAQEEDRRDIEGPDHHGEFILHGAMSDWQWSHGEPAG
jgi:hypothetical protein